MDVVILKIMQFSLVKFQKIWIKLLGPNVINFDMNLATL